MGVVFVEEQGCRGGEFRHPVCLHERRGAEHLARPKSRASEIGDAPSVDVLRHLRLDGGQEDVRTAQRRVQECGS